MGMRQRLSQLDDPQYLDDLLALQSSAPQPEHPESKVRDEVEALRAENKKLKASLAEAQQEKTEMSKVLIVLEDRLAKSNEYLRDAFCSNQAQQAKCRVS